MSDLVFGRRLVAEALRSGVPVRRIVMAEGLAGSPILEEISSLAASAGVPVSHRPRGEISNLSRTRSHQGVLAEVAPFGYASLEAILSKPKRRLVLLDGVTDPGNLGSILRSAEAFGFTGVLVPKRRGVGVTPAVRKVASGAAERVPVAQVGSPADAVGRLRSAGVLVVGLHPDANERYEGVEYPSSNLCLVLGAEGRGLSRLVRDRCDLLVRIEVAAAMASVNVAVAGAIVMVEVARSRGPANG